MTRSHKRAHVANWDRIKRRRELKRDGQLLDMPEVNFMAQSNGYEAPQGRPRSTPPATWMSDTIADRAASQFIREVEQPAVEPIKSRGVYVRSPEYREAMSRSLRNSTLQSRAKATRLAARLNDLEPVPGATWMTITQFAKATGRARSAATNYTAKPSRKHWQHRTVKAPGHGVRIYAIPHDELPEQFRPDLPVIAPPMVALQTSLWSRFCQWVGW